MLRSAVMVLALLAACRPPCDASSCPPPGCCNNDVCFLSGCGDDAGACVLPGRVCTDGGLRCCQGTSCQPSISAPAFQECRP